jgi:Protein of unknown function (DUF3306)
LIVADALKPTEHVEPVLSRWSRLKRGQSGQNNTVAKNNENELIAQSSGAMTANADRADSISEQHPLEAKTATDDDALPSLTDIALDRDFTPFMQSKVPEALKRQALKTLFKDAHFNIMDGLDTYIDDYTKFEPISPEEMAGLSAWKSIMKPLEQVVTPGGYAVDVESEEGKAVLATREALSVRAEAKEPGNRDANTVESEPVVPALPHERYGKRVGDFQSDYVPLPISESELAATEKTSSEKSIADDPR